MQIRINKDISGLYPGSANAQNTSDYLDIPCYDGTYHAIHPDVLHLSVDFGYAKDRYYLWMAFTPYTSSDVENPSIVASPDGVNWVVPPFLANPIEPKPMNGHNSDPDLYYEDNALYLIWRDVISQNLSQPWTCHIYSRKLVNGAGAFEDKILLLESLNDDFLSPAIVKVEDEYRIYAVQNITGSTNKLRYYHSSNLESDWSLANVVECSFNRQPEGKEPWHINMNLINGKYVALITYCDINSNGNNSILYLAVSDDGINFVVGQEPLLSPVHQYSGWDDIMIYRSTLVEYNGEYWLYYSALGHNGWFTGLTTVQGLDFLKYGYIKKITVKEFTCS